MKRTLFFAVISLSVPSVAFAAPQTPKPSAKVGQVAKPKAPKTEAVPQVEAVNINEASPEQLALLPGVGASTAAEIVAHRKQQPLTCAGLADVIPGISAKKAAIIQPHCTETGATTLTTKLGRDGEPSKAKATGAKKVRLAGNTSEQ